MSETYDFNNECTNYSITYESLHYSTKCNNIQNIPPNIKLTALRNN